MEIDSTMLSQESKNIAAIVALEAGVHRSCLVSICFDPFWAKNYDTFMTLHCFRALQPASTYQLDLRVVRMPTE